MDFDKQKLLDECIMVIGGVALVEIHGKLYILGLGSSVHAIGGVPHTWTACSAGGNRPDGTVLEGKFTMFYEYEEPT